MTPVVHGELARQEQRYFDAPGLSNSGMSDLAVSPLRYWYLHLSPDRPAVEPTIEMQLGSALHCALLETDQFEKRYAQEMVPPAGALDTIEDLRRFLRENGQTPKGTRKAEVIAQVQSFAHLVPIISVLEQRHAEEHAGKVVFKADDWSRVAGMAHALLDEPRVKAILEGPGNAEHPTFWTDAETGVALKMKIDWAAPAFNLDLKSFTQKRGKTIDKTVADSILYEQYYRQAFVYAIGRGWPKDFPGDFVMPFVESEPPHEVRIKVLRPKTGGNANLYWEKARVEVRQLIRTYAECMSHFGPDKPWRYAQEINPLIDEDMPGMAFGQ